MYPYYLTQTVNGTFCLFTFFAGGTQASVNCLKESVELTHISPSILNNTYFQTITQVSVANRSSFSQLPVYLCSLPSKSIDLSNQSFTTLNNQTFPCGSDSTLQIIDWSNNRINTVDVKYNNWLSIVLTANNLSVFPYTLFNVAANIRSARDASTEARRTLLLQSNRLTKFDLFLYTYANTNIDLRNNPFINNSNGFNSIENVLNQSLTFGTISTNISFPGAMRFLINDILPQDYNACSNSRTLNYLIDILSRIISNGVTVEIECQCSSFYIKEYYKRYNASTNITNRFRCSNRSTLTATAFENLLENDCLASLAQSSRRLCSFARLQVRVERSFDLFLIFRKVR